MPRISSWIVRHYRLLALTCAVASFASGACLGLFPPRQILFWVLFVTAIATTAGAVGLPMYAEHNTAQRARDAVEAAEEAKAQMLLVTNSVLNPLAYLLGALTDADSKAEIRELQGLVCTMVLSGTTELISTPSNTTRTSFFRIQPGRPPRKMNIVAWYGTPDPPTWNVVEGTPLGDAFFEILEQDKIAFYPDLQTMAPAGWTLDNYQALIVVPVATPKQRLGLLIVENTAPNSMSDQDVDVVRLLGELLATALNQS